MKRRILIIYTGGTIGMIQDHDTRVLKPFNFNKILSEFPEIKRFNHKLDSISFNPAIDSSDITISIWQRIAQTIYDNYNKYDGFVVLQGTDTMSYSASALSFMLKNLQKPVIFTGSQLPIGMLRTDGRDNLIAAIEIAAYRKQIVPEVSILFENRLMRGNRTTKHNSEDFDAFHSYNYGALAEIGIRIKYNKRNILKPKNKEFAIQTKLNNNVVIIKLFPSIKKNILESILGTSGLQGVVLETYGAGNATTEKWFLDAIGVAIKNGINIVNVSQCRAGYVDMSIYDAGIGLQKIGVIDGKDITTESAVTKLMFLLGNGLSQEELKKHFQVSICGEMS